MKQTSQIGCVVYNQFSHESKNKHEIKSLKSRRVFPAKALNKKLTKSIRMRKESARGPLR